VVTGAARGWPFRTSPQPPLLPLAGGADENRRGPLLRQCPAPAWGRAHLARRTPRSRSQDGCRGSSSSLSREQFRV